MVLRISGARQLRYGLRQGALSYCKQPVIRSLGGLPFRPVVTSITATYYYTPYRPICHDTPRETGTDSLDNPDFNNSACATLRKVGKPLRNREPGCIRNRNICTALRNRHTPGSRQRAITCRHHPRPANCTQDAPDKASRHAASQSQKRPA